MASVWASMPCAASTSRITPSHAASDRDDLVAEVDVARRVDEVEDVVPASRAGRSGALIVMPRSRSRSIESRYCARMSRASTAPQSSRMRSASVRLAVVDVGDDADAAEAVEVGHEGVGVHVRDGPAGGERASVPARVTAGPDSPSGCDIRIGPRPVVTTRGATHYGCRAVASHLDEDPVANIKSQIKRNKQNEKARVRNKIVRSELRTRTKTAISTATEGSENAPEALRQAIKRIDTAAAKGVIHPNQAARSQVPPDPPDQRPRRRLIFGDDCRRTDRVHFSGRLVPPRRLSRATRTSSTSSPGHAVPPPRNVRSASDKQRDRPSTALRAERLGHVQRLTGRERRALDAQHRGGVALVRDARTVEAGDSQVVALQRRHELQRVTVA